MVQMNVRTLLPLLWLLATPLATEHALVAQEAPTAQAQPAFAQAPALPGQGTSPGGTQLPAEPIATPDTPLSIPPIDRELPAAAEVPATGAMAIIDRAMGSVNDVIAAFFFFDVLFWDPAHRLPLVVL
ncbi:hypothetical protein BH20GEM3_BH20GEM3_13170 [soil metagenome]